MPTALLPDPKDWRFLVPGPLTITYTRAGDARVLIAAGYALLLQVSHPTVGAGVSGHSQFRHDPWGRLLRTLDYTTTMVYGGPEAAGAMGRRIHSFHKHIYGEDPDGFKYHALDPEAYAWVHATLADAIVLAHERFGRPFNLDQRQLFWSEWLSLGRLLGIRERDLPTSWQAFRDYFDYMVDCRLRRTDAVDEVMEALARPAPPPLRVLHGRGWATLRPILGHASIVASVGLLPPTLRHRFGVRWTPVRELEFRAMGSALPAMTPLMPSWLLNSGPGYLRWRKDALARGDVASLR
jgi:uncharacterized protein (DUF2236 family)